MRALSTAAIAMISRKTGSEPINVIEIDWPQYKNLNGSVQQPTLSYYADKGVDGINIDAYILDIGGIDEVVKLSEGASAAQVSITIDDTSGNLKRNMDIFDIQKRPLRIYQYFAGLNYTVDKFLIFSGETVSPIVWDERNRTVTLEAITITVSSEVGFAPEEGQFGQIASDEADKVWPLCFGSPVYVPATLARTNLVGTLMSRMGVPDPTLPYKKELLEYRRDQIKRAIEYYDDLQKKTNKKSRPAKTIQKEYANHIIGYDGLKQTIEDAKIELEAMIKQLDQVAQEHADPMNEGDRDALEDEFVDIRDARNKQRAILKGLYAQRRQMEQAELAFKQEVENAKFYVGLIDKLKKKVLKLKKDLLEIEKELSILIQAMTFQATLNQTSANVWDGTKFPQEKDLRYDVNNAIFLANMKDRVLTFKKILPKYENIKLDERKNSSPELFWLKPDEDKKFRDGNGRLINLTGMFIQTDGGKIVRVIDQKDDGTCKIEPPHRISTRKTVRKEIDYTGNAIDKQAFDEGMKHLLSGSETDKQKEEIANDIPKDISPEIWNILYGGRRVQLIELICSTENNEPVSDFVQSNFTLMYGDEEITAPIYFTDTEVEIRDKITKSILALPPNSIAVVKLNSCTDPDGVNGFRQISITFNSGLMKPFRIYEAQLFKDPLETRTDSLVIGNIGQNDPSATLGIQRELLVDPNMVVAYGGRLMLMVNGRILPFNSEDIGSLDGDTLQGILEAPVKTFPVDDTDLGDLQPICQPNEIVCTGGPLSSSNIFITYNTTFKPMLIDGSVVAVGKSDGKVTLDLILGSEQYDEASGKYYRPLDFYRWQLLDPQQALELSGEFVLALSGSDEFEDQDVYWSLDAYGDLTGGALTRAALQGDDPIANTDNFQALGGPLSVAPIKIFLGTDGKNTLDATLRKVSVAPTGKGLGKRGAFEQKDFKSEFLPTKPSISLGITYSNQGASEYTARERDDKLKEQVGKSVSSNALLFWRQQVQDTLKEVKYDELTGELDEDTQIQLAKNLSNFASVNNKIDETSLSLEDIYRLIDQEEKKLLYELEIIAYLEVKLKLKEVKADEDEAYSPYEFTAIDFKSITAASPVILKEWLAYLDVAPKKGEERSHRYWKVKQISLLPNSTAPFIGEVGDKVSLEDQAKQKYIANCLPSTIRNVSAWKRVNGIRRLVPLSQLMYEKDENDQSYGNQFTVTSITLNKPLKYYDEKWDDDIYVTLVSPIGPNVCDIIEYIVNEYTTCTIDETSFSTVFTYQISYPCNFAILEKIDAFALIEDIAWQARCKIWVRNQKVFIMYLPREPETVVATLNTSVIEEGSLQMHFTPTEELVTTLVGAWRPDYSKDRDWKMTVRRNVRRYGEQREERNIFIYNDENLVKKSLTFWLIRLSGTYKIAKMRVFLDSLVIETNDYVKLNVGNAFTFGPINGLVINSEYDSLSNSVDLAIWLPVLSGTMIQYNFANPADLSVTAKFPDPLDIINGDAGSQYGVNIPTGSGFDPYDDELEDLRPRDFGKPDISDLNDEIPKDPASEFDEVSYNVTINDKELDAATKYKYAFTDIDQQHTNRELEALEFQATIGMPTSDRTGSTTIGYGRIMQVDDGEQPPVPDEKTGSNKTSYQTFYKVEMANGEIIRARQFQKSPQAIPYNQVVLIVKDSFSKDYVFQPTITNPPKDFGDLRHKN